MLAKCYWKMYQTPTEKLDKTDQRAPVTIKQLLKTLQNSIDVATRARKSRNSDPILEPHYKIVSILHKLVTRGDMDAVEAASNLSGQPFGVPINPQDRYAGFSQPENWNDYVIQSLTRLRDKDKSNWQHRIAMRQARILFEGDEAASDGFTVAKAAFAILRENIFTKTMVMNVWKCDAERPGRHHVFTEQYVRFVTGLLDIMSDRTNMELLLRRLRKKGADFYHFTDLWQSCCQAYLNLLRAAHGIRAASEDAFKALPSEEFEIISERITEWAAGEGPHVAGLSCMREAVELKKLNANLMKVAPIDDLINDCYTEIYIDVASKLPGMEPSRVVAERNRAKEVAAGLEQADPRPPSSLSSILNPPNTREGLGGTSTPNEAEKAEAARRGRRTVRRPDVLRKAEQAVLRSLEAPSKSVASKSWVGSVSSKRGSQTPAVALSEAGGSSDSDEEGPDAQVKREAGDDADEEMKDADATEEAGDDEDHGDARTEGKEDTEAGSIHDSADESDLSDVPEGYDEEVPPGLLFPNLGRPAEQSSEASGEEADSESEGNDGDETEELVEDDGGDGDESEEHEREGDGVEDEVDELEEMEEAEVDEVEEEAGAEMEDENGDETEDVDTDMADGAAVEAAGREGPEG